jgi:hypothetical protein
MISDYDEDEPMKTIDAESLMDDAVRAADGQHVREIVGVNPSFDNADYLFATDNVVAELKSLEKDLLTDPTVKEKLHNLYNRWIDEGKDVPVILGEGILRSDQLPIECAREIVAIFKDRIEGTALRKASRQIRETKEHLNHPNAIGLLLISNEGNFAFDPAMLAHVLHHSLRSKFSSIEHVILFSATLGLGDPTPISSRPPFISIRFPNRRQPADTFLNRLGTCWYETLGAATGQTFSPIVFTRATRSDIDQLRFVPRP